VILWTVLASHFSSGQAWMGYVVWPTALVIVIAWHVALLFRDKDKVLQCVFALANIGAVTYVSFIASALLFHEGL
jgi:hypothetical protein